MRAAQLPLISTSTSGQVFNINAPQELHVPAGIVHQLSNQQSGVLLFTVTSTPTSHGDRLII